MKSFVFQCEFHWSKFVPMGPIDNKPALVQVRLVACSAPSHYLNQRWPSSLMHKCGTRGRWVKHNHSLTQTWSSLCLQMFWHIMVKDHKQAQYWLSTHLNVWRLIQNNGGQLTSIGVPIVEIRLSYDLMSLKSIPLKSLPHVPWVNELMLVRLLLFCNDKILSF